MNMKINAKQNRKKLSYAEAEDILAVRLAKIFVDQILDGKKDENESALKNDDDSLE